MGKDIHVAIVIRNTQTGHYDKVEIFNKKKDKYISIPPYDVRNYELFSLLEEDVPSNGLHTAFLEPSLVKEILEKKDTIGYFGFKEVNLADLKNYLICNPTIIDYEKDEECNKTNPIKFFIERIEYYIEFAGYEYYYPSDVYILYWFDN
jgi:hypothetical protein